jgi:co-chaperonin GroES (HSP10)
MFELLGNFILVEKQKKGENVTKGGIYLTEEDNSQDAVQKATVVSFSKNVDGFEVGDVLTFAKQCFLMQITIEGKKYHTIHPEEVLGIERIKYSKEK